MMTAADLALYNISNLKLGKRAPVQPAGLSHLMAYTKGGFPKPPPTFGTLSVLQAIPWGMDGNDALSDCVIAGVDHVIARENAIEHTNDPRPALAIIESQYHFFSPNDDGCVIADVLQIWRSSGLFHHMPMGPNKIAQYAPFNYQSRTELMQVIAYLGNAYLGIACPVSAQQQFAMQVQTGQLVPWTVVNGSPIDGGHCIVAVGYTADGLLCVTWGGVVLVTWAFMAQYCDEAWAILSHEIVEHGADTFGLDTAKLQADLDALI
ncbi:MAG TPA: hypothetical protein VK771_04630 [Acidimicrobiia bacterium]|nr:hypothetical protein [Acidimicrobiia bacterium]